MDVKKLIFADLDKYIEILEKRHEDCKRLADDFNTRGWLEDAEKLYTTATQAEALRHYLIGVKKEIEEILESEKS